MLKSRRSAPVLGRFRRIICLFLAYISDEARKFHAEAEAEADVVTKIGQGVRGNRGWRAWYSQRWYVNMLSLTRSLLRRMRGSTYTVVRSSRLSGSTEQADEPDTMSIRQSGFGEVVVEEVVVEHGHDVDQALMEAIQERTGESNGISYHSCPSCTAFATKMYRYVQMPRPFRTMGTL